MSDVVVVGGGVIGLTIAYELAGQGTTVTVLDQATPGKEASWAGAGMLPPGNIQHAQTPLARLRAASHALWTDLTHQLYEESGIDNGYRNCGSLIVSLQEDNADVQEELQTLLNNGITVEELSATQLNSHEPTLNSNINQAWFLPEFCQIRNPRHLKALLAGCAARNVQVLSGEAAYHFEIQNGKISSVLTNNGSFSAGQFIITSGAWSGQLLHSVGYKIPIEPIRGQIALLSATPGLIRHVIEYGPRYLVPRPDGRILIGSTVEQVGFDKSNTAGAVNELIAFGTKLVPALAEATFERCWAGLRPRTPDSLPLIGTVEEIENLFIATGHFRDGLQLSPITAVLIRELLHNQTPTVPLEPFACNRFRESAFHN